MSISTFTIPLSARVLATDEFVYVIAIERTADRSIRFHIVRNGLHDVVDRKALRLFPGEAVPT